MVNQTSELQVDIPMFDSLSHPTIDGTWTQGRSKSGFGDLAASIDPSRFFGACAVGLGGVGAYEHHEFIECCNRVENLFPVAGLTARNISELSREVEVVKSAGYSAVKIHPRLLGFSRDITELMDVLLAAREQNMTVFFCTYLHTGTGFYPRREPVYELAALLENAGEPRTILLHGGGTDVLRYSELVRFNDNLLLDLSFTMMKYAGSSVDQDIAWLFNNFDQRVCVGSDFPEYTHEQVQTRFDSLSNGVDVDKLRNIAYRNLTGFIGIGEGAEKWSRRR